ncbi:MAG: hypothetical protein A2176_07835 [Spirochaetes bacterium RBG_13_51_14]|nr:MAG: hypothetical protein A2176_07835 [Spirochaetes bacterium RBG_13_51_14]
MIFVDLSTFVQTLKVIFSRKWRSPKRILWTCISLFFVTTVYTLNVIFRLMDEILFHGYRKMTIRPPLIIAANPRSGTTYLHRLLCLDGESFTYFRLYHTIFPSITLYRIFDFFAWIDTRTGRTLSKFIEWMNRLFFGGWEHIHTMGLDRAEEDEALFLYNFATPALYMLFPVFRDVASLRFADSLPEWKQKEIARYYRRSVQRFLYATGSEQKIFLLKSVLFNSRMKIVTSVFPDARVVYLVRNPYEVLPSTINMFTKMWKLHSPEIPKDSDVTREWARLGIDYYRYFHDNRNLMDRSNYLALLYSDLVLDPVGMVKKIYDTFNMTMSRELLDRLENEAGENNNFKSNHDYSLEEYGIDREWVYNELRDIFDEYGLEP